MSSTRGEALGYYHDGVRWVAVEVGLSVMSQVLR
jgi:hypothetical protein